MDGIRLNKYIANCGICSRREADKLIAAGRVLIGGKLPELGSKVSDGDEVTIDGKAITLETKKRVIALYKPEGYVCTEAEFKGEKNIQELIAGESRLFSIGRLDKNSEGLILMTNDGAFAQEVSRSAGEHEKEYEVTIDEEVTAEFLSKMRAGVEIDIDGKLYTTKPCKVIKKGPKGFNIILTQGFNRQIRRMTRACGCHVRTLKRVRVMNVTIGDLKPGEWKDVSDCFFSDNAL